MARGSDERTLALAHHFDEMYLTQCMTGGYFINCRCQVLDMSTPAQEHQLKTCLTGPLNIQQFLQQLDQHVTSQDPGINYLAKKIRSDGLPSKLFSSNERAKFCSDSLPSQLHINLIV